MTDRLAEIQARFDGFDARGTCPNCAHAAMVHGGAVADGLAGGPPPGCPDHCGPVTDDDIAYLLERVREWRELAEEAITEFDDARFYAREYSIMRWRYDATSALFAERRAALTEGESNG